MHYRLEIAKVFLYSLYRNDPILFRVYFSVGYVYVYVEVSLRLCIHQISLWLLWLGSLFCNVLNFFDEHNVFEYQNDFAVLKDVNGTKKIIFK